MNISYQWNIRGHHHMQTLVLNPAHKATVILFPDKKGMGKVSLQMIVPVSEINGIWHLYCSRNTLQKITWRETIACCPFSNSPFLALVDRNLINRLMLIAEPIEKEVRISWALDQAKASYHITVDWGERKLDDEIKIHLNARNAPVYELASDLMDRLFQPSPAEDHKNFFKPTWCTWYAFHGAVDQKNAEASAKLATKLGFGNFILDDGWSYDTYQRVGPVLGPWHRYQGDFIPSRKKFPDFSGHIEYVKSLGLRYTLWIAPFLVGIKSKSFSKLKKHLLDSWLDEGFKVPDPRAAQVRDHLTEKLKQLVHTYPMDGFKVDYDYALMGPDNSFHGVGPAYADFVRSLLPELRKINPQLEWNLTPTLFSRQTAHALRCLDTPFDPETNRFSMVNCRLIAGSLPLQFDPALWSNTDSISTVYRHLIPSIFCVPSIGTPLLNLPASHLNAIRSWLNFYRRHQQILNHGRFYPRWAGSDYQSFHINHENQEIAATFSQYPVVIANTPVTRLINATDCSSLNITLSQKSKITIEDANGREIQAKKKSLTGLQNISCPPGLILRIEK